MPHVKCNHSFTERTPLLSRTTTSTSTRSSRSDKAVVQTWDTFIRGAAGRQPPLPQRASSWHHLANQGRVTMYPADRTKDVPDVEGTKSAALGSSEVERHIQSSPMSSASSSSREDRRRQGVHLTEESQDEGYRDEAASSPSRATRLGMGPSDRSPASLDTPPRRGGGRQGAHLADKNQGDSISEVAKSRSTILSGLGPHVFRPPPPESLDDLEAQTANCQECIEAKEEPHRRTCRAQCVALGCWIAVVVLSGLWVLFTKIWS